MIKHIILFALITASLQIPHCKETSKTCKSCKDGYTLVKYNYERSECIEKEKLKLIQEKLQNCIDANEDNTICYTCERGYVLNSSQKCIKKDYCQELDENDKCKDCGYYALDSDSGNCIEKPLCRKVSGSKCTECFQYYYLNKNGECKRIPLEHCLVGNSEECSLCDDYYHVVKGKCEKIGLEHCISLEEEDSTKCEECDEYYYAKDGKCEKYPDHCVSYNSYEDVCQSCEEGYYPSNSKCLRANKVDNCEEYNSENKCGCCAPSYYLNSDKNECIKVAKAIDNCIYYSDATHCSECDEYNGYDVSENEEECDKYCDTEEICEECEYNYISLDYGKTCTIVDSSLQTNDGNRLNSLNFVFVIFLLFAL